ncbi:band 4.1-like protein 4A isoform X3 [Macrobrachium rosenbergii]|uniref:band 4.1-like protein 4A isoform X3 n=2 Tax=Macrobrachium rosenbergii TaxID=79674 RepID=UPI0034D4BFAB
MKCFGDKSRTYHCKVVLLDEQELIQEIQDTTTGQDLLERVFQHLNLMETAYFGLRYLDPSNQTHWLDPAKKVVKQLKAFHWTNRPGTSPFTLYFSVKFYAADPCKLVEEITRYQFFLQVKQDILQGRLPISQELAAELGSYAVQSELGDYDPRRHSPGYVSEFRFVTTQTVALENKIAELHKKLVGQVPSKAEMCYLEKVKWLDMYGVDLHPVLGEDNIEYFLGLTPSGVIVLRNKAKVGNYFWPRISKVYFRGRFFMLRVRDKNNSENTYGFETPSKAACKHLWQCCVEHHAFFRLTQASGNSPAAIFSLGSKFRYSGRTEKEAVQDAKLGSRTQPEFTRMPSRRYQRRIVEGAQDTPRVEDIEVKPETRSTVQLPTPVSTVSHMYRSTSMTLSPRSDSPRSTRSAPYPAGVASSGGTATILGNRNGDHRPRGESPRSVHSAAATSENCRVSRRTSSVDSQSSVDSRGHRRHRRSRGRSSDGESEASSKGSSRGHRRHRHRHHSDDSDHHRHRHRRRRHKSGSAVNDAQWVEVKEEHTQVRGHTATVRDLTHKSGYQPSGHDTEADSQHHQHSNKKRHRKHRSRSRSPSEAKNSRLPDELRQHLDFKLQMAQGLTEAELREIPYTKVETAKTIKIKYTSPKTKRHKSPRRSKSNSSDRKATPPADGESPPPPYTPSPANKNNTLPKSSIKENPEDHDKSSEREGMVNGTLHPAGPRSAQASTMATTSSTQSSDRASANKRWSDSATSTSVKTSSSSTSNGNSSFGYIGSSTHKPVMVNGPSVKALVTSSASTASPTLSHEASSPDSSTFMEENGGSFASGNSFVNSASNGFKSVTNERGSHFTAVLKPQPSPQSSVTSGISVGSSSRSGYTSTLPRPGSNSNPNDVGIPPFSSSVTSSSPAPSASSVFGGCESSTVSRNFSNKPHMKTTGSQTNNLRTTASQTNQSNPGQRASSKSSSNKTTETSQGNQTANGTNLAHSALHWKVYNWDAYREEAEWSNSLGRSIKSQGQEGNQASTAVVSDNAVNAVKVNGFFNGHHTNGSGSKTSLTLNGFTPKSKTAPISGEFIKINGKVNGHTNGHVKSNLNSFTSGNFIIGDTNGHFKNYSGHMNGFSKGFFGGHPSDHSNAYLNSSFEIESKNNKNVTFKIPAEKSHLRISSGNITDGPLSGNHEESNLKIKNDIGLCTPSKVSLKQGEVTDEISTEL